MKIAAAIARAVASIGTHDVFEIPEDVVLGLQESLEGILHGGGWK